MPKKIVIKARINCDKCRTKALKIAAGTDGVKSLAIQGADNDEVVVTGDGIDSVTLTCTLRKRLGYADIVTEEEEKANKKEGKKPETPTEIIPSICYWPPLCEAVLVCDPNPSPCSIL